MTEFVFQVKSTNKNSNALLGTSYAYPLSFRGLSLRKRFVLDP